MRSRAARRRSSGATCHREDVCVDRPTLEPVSVAAPSCSPRRDRGLQSIALLACDSRIAGLEAVVLKERIGAYLAAWPLEVLGMKSFDLRLHHTIAAQNRGIPDYIDAAVSQCDERIIDGRAGMRP